MDAISADHALYGVFVTLLLFLSIVYLQWSSSRRDAALLQQLYKRLEHVPDRLASVQERQQDSTRNVTRVQEHLERVEERLDRHQIDRNKENAKVRPPTSADSDIVKTIDLLSNRIYALSRTNARDEAPRNSLPAREIARLESQIEQQKTLHARALTRAEEAKDLAEQRLQKHIHGAIKRDAGTDGQVDSALNVEFKLKVAEKEHDLQQQIEKARGEIMRANKEISDLQAEKLKSDEAVQALEKMHDAEVAQLENELKRAATRRASSSQHELRANQLQAELNDLKSDHQDEVVMLKKTTETLTAELAIAKYATEVAEANATEPTSQLVKLKTEFEELQAKYATLETRHEAAVQRCEDVENDRDEEAKKTKEETTLAHRQAIAKVFEKLQPEIDARTAAEKKLYDAVARAEELETQLAATKERQESAAIKTSANDSVNYDEAESAATITDLQHKLEEANNGLAYFYTCVNSDGTEQNPGLLKLLELKTIEADRLQDEVIQLEMDGEDEPDFPAAAKFEVPEHARGRVFVPSWEKAKPEPKTVGVATNSSTFEVPEHARGRVFIAASERAAAEKSAPSLKSGGAKAFVPSWESAAEVEPGVEKETLKSAGTATPFASTLKGAAARAFVPSWEVETKAEPQAFVEDNSPTPAPKLPTTKEMHVAAEDKAPVPLEPQANSAEPILSQAPVLLSVLKTPYSGDTGLLTSDIPPLSQTTTTTLSRSWASGSLRRPHRFPSPTTSLPTLDPNTDFFIGADEPGYIDGDSSGVVNVICKRCNAAVDLPFARSAQEDMELHWSGHEKRCGSNKVEGFEVKGQGGSEGKEDATRKYVESGTSKLVIPRSSLSSKDLLDALTADPKDAAPPQPVASLPPPLSAASRPDRSTSASSSTKQFSGGMMSSRYATQSRDEPADFAPPPARNAPRNAESRGRNASRGGSRGRSRGNGQWGGSERGGSERGRSRSRGGRGW